MIKTLLTLVLCLISSQFFAQNFQKPSSKEIQTLPLWAQKMYGEHPNVFEVDSLVRSYYKSHAFEKNYHTQYYKRWKRSLRDLTGADGYPIVLTADQKAANKTAFKAKSTVKSGNSNWSIVGPITNFQEGLSQGSGQTNIYSFDQCIGSPTFMYCGTEPGEVYKSIDGGNNWTLTSKGEDFGSGVTSVEVDPVNPQIVFAGGNDGVFRSIDGGITWTNVLPNSNFGVNEILINSGNTQIVLAATDKGLYRSIDGGVNWTQLFLNKTYDLKMNVVTSSTVYLLRNNPNDEICEFAISTDSGLTWTVQSTGWYSSTDPARNDGGGRLAVTPADPNRVYAYLIGEAKANDYGYIGVYKSTNGGMSWTLPNGPAGGPYDANHINLAIGQPTWLYHQGFYNCAIMANPTDADDIIVGGLSTYHSTDGAATFESINGYAGGFLNMHVDNQDFRIIGNDFWITTDGGIYHSTDFFTTQPDFLMSGVHGSDYWGFGSGWNEDVLVGGLYHNGNLAYHENYGAGNFLELGGGEAPTGYVNPGNNRKTYFSDIDGKIIPLNLADPIQNSAFSIDPNESYWGAESTEMEFHPNCYNIAYVGKNADLWKTTDGGGSFQLLHNFSASTNANIAHIEVASDNSNVIYTHLRPASGATGTLFKTFDGGVNWSQLSIPAGNSTRMLIAVDPENSSKLWIAYPSGSNGNKVYESTNGGTTWTNITSAALNNETPHSMVYIAGTTDGLYLATNKATYYRDGGTNWQLDNAGLPTFTNGNILRPFYRDGKIRVATYGKGIWESALSENPSHPIARIMVDKLSQEVTCAVDSFYFDDYSYLNHTGASWNWTFPTGTPATSTQRNPAVYFDQAGTHLAILQITDGNGFTDSDSLYVTVSNVVLPQAQLMEDFETAFLPYAWSVNNPDNDGQWSQSADAGGFGTSPKSAIFDNFNIYGMGKLDDLIIPLDASLPITELTLKFDVAYARWGGANSDSLSVHVSTDCGQTMQQLFFNGGTGLSTSPDFQDFFIPTASQWRTETLDLSSFIGESNLQVIFRNHGYYGNGIYLDNINISSDLGIEATKFKEAYQVYPNPSSAGNSVFVEVPENATIYLIDQKGKRVSSTKGTGKIQFDLPASVSAGMYQLQIVTAKEIVNKRLMITK